MNRTNGGRGAAMALALTAVLPLAVPAQTGGPYDLTWSTVDAGGGTFSTGGTYSLGATAGQPDAGSSAGGSYNLTGGFWHAGGTVVGIGDDPEATPAPTVLRIHPSAPNPFSTSTTLAVDLPAGLPVEVRVYNLAGQLVRTLTEGFRPAGSHQITWDGADAGGRRLARGVYLLRTKVGVSSRTQKLVLVN